MTATDPTARHRAVLFDLDGVLLDSAAAVSVTLAAVATCATGRRHTLADLPPDVLTLPRCDVLAQLGVEDPDTACERWWDGALAAATPPALFPGILDGLHVLRANGVKVGVVTVQDRQRVDWLLPSGLADLIDVVITRSDAAPKPAPDGVHAALHHLGVHPQHAAMLGDSPGDILAAQRAGVLALGAAWGYNPPATLLQAGARHILRDPASIGTPLLEHLSRRR